MDLQEGEGPAARASAGRPVSRQRRRAVARGAAGASRHRAGPAWLVARELAAGTLRAVLDDFAGSTTAIRALYPARRRRNARLDVFVAHLAQTLALDLPRVGEP